MRALVANRTFASLFMQNFLVFSGLNLLNVVPDHLVAIGGSKSYVGLYMNLGSLLMVLLVAPLSRYTDRIGRRRLLLGSYTAAVAGNAAMYFMAGDLTALMILRLVSAFLFCTVFTIYSAEAFGLFPRERRMTGMALFGISGLLSNPVSAWIGERLLEGAGAPWLFVASIGFFLPGALLCLRYPFHRPSADGPAPSGFLALLAKREIWVYLVVGMVMGGAFSVLFSFLANLSRERLGSVQISVFLAAFSLSALAVRLLVVRRLEHLPKNWLAALCFAAIGLTTLLAWRLDAVWQLALMGALYGFGNGLLYPLTAAAIVNAGRDEDRLGLNNLFSLVNTLGNVAVGIPLGGLADRHGTGSIFLVMAIVAFATLPLAAWGVGRKPKVPRS